MKGTLKLLFIMRSVVVSLSDSGPVISFFLKLKRLPTG